MKGIAAFACAVLLAGCDPTPASDAKMNAAQERLSAEAVAEVGMPAIVNFQEKRMMKTIIELRDQAISTTAYLVTRDAKLVWFCDSVGYGLPYATEYTNPQKVGWSQHETGVIALPQADPNGLFSPPDAHGTWVLCKDPNGADVKPIYVEPDVIVSPFPLIAKGKTP